MPFSRDRIKVSMFTSFFPLGEGARKPAAWKST